MIAAKDGYSHAAPQRTDERLGFDERPAKRPHSTFNGPTNASLDATVSFSAVHDWWQVLSPGAATLSLAASYFAQ